MNLSNIAESIKRARLSQNMTVEQLAQKAGFTKGYISKLENFRVTPSVSALTRIAKALGAPVSSFFEDGLKSVPYLRGTIGGGEELDRNEGKKYGIKYMSQAFQKLDRAMDPFILEYSPSGKIREMMMHDADEFCVVLDGSINFYIGDMSKCETLKAGDTLYLSANMPHATALPPKFKSARVLIVYCSAKNKA
jgi:transcriptional regulator with XRE-family HTH domain